MKLLDKNGLEYYTSKVKETLTDYVKNTDYASSSKGGVIKVSGTFNYGQQSGSIYPIPRTYEQYRNLSDYAFIGKVTLENVLNARIGDIDTILETLTTGTGV